ncbi:hypothetical protein ACS0TY_019907 [Phlomoides rotata]
MTDPNPLLSETESPALDDTIEHCIGDFGYTQFLQSVVSSFAWFFDAQQTFIAVFTDALTNGTCSPDELPDCRSIVSEWSLDCSDSIIRGLPSSSFFLGCLSGGFLLSTLADSSLGRKNLLALSCLLTSLAGIITSLSTNVLTYAAFRFLSGFFRSAIGTCALVLATELVARKYRGSIGIFGFVWFTFGFLSLPLIAFLLKGYSWRLIYLCTCIPCLIYSVFVYFFVHESPRWLFVKGRKEEFIKTLTAMADKRTVSHKISSLLNSVECKPHEEYNIYSAFKILLSKWWALRRLAAAMVVAFGLGTVYLGMPLTLGNLSMNLYLNVTLNALSELPASVLTFFLIGKVNRKGCLMGLAVVSGICSVGCAVWWDMGIQIPLELLCFFCGCTAVNVVLIYTMELFPTCVRNSAVAMVRQAIVFSGVVSPLVVAAGGENGWLPYGVFGATIGVCGLFAVWLPETRGRTLCDTMEEEEELQYRHSVDY